MQPMNTPTPRPIKTLKSGDITDAADRINIINLWSDLSEISSGYKTRFCDNPTCLGDNCRWSHSFIKRYPIVRCRWCSTENCENDKLSSLTIQTRDKSVEIFIVCRRVAWELEDQAFFERLGRRNHSNNQSRRNGRSDETVKINLPNETTQTDNKQITSKQVVSEPTNSDLTRFLGLEKLKSNLHSISPALRNLLLLREPTPSSSDLRKQNGGEIISQSNQCGPNSNPNHTKHQSSSTADSHRYRTDLTKPNPTLNLNSAKGDADRHLLGASDSDIPGAKSAEKKRLRDQGGLVVYYFRAGPTTKRALVHLVENDNFKGQVRISEPHLQEVIRKLSDEDIIALKSDLVDLPGADDIIERAELRLQNINLQEQLKALKKQ